jgi:DNA-binding phage protein
MPKAKTSRRLKQYAMKSLKVYEPFISKELKDPRHVTDALFECLKNGDLESFRDVLIAHLMTANKSLIAKKAGIGRRTLYDLLDPEKEFNPELATIAAVIRAIAA